MPPDPSSRHTCLRVREQLSHTTIILLPSRFSPPQLMKPWYVREKPSTGTGCYCCQPVSRNQTQPRRVRSDCSTSWLPNHLQVFLEQFLLFLSLDLHLIPHLPCKCPLLLPHLHQPCFSTLFTLLVEQHSLKKKRLSQAVFVFYVISDNDASCIQKYLVSTELGLFPHNFCACQVCLFPY